MPTQQQKPETIIDGLAWPENPRWRDGALYYVDMFLGTIYRWTEDGGPELIGNVPGGIAGGLGWLPNGDLLAVAVEDRLIFRLPAGGGEAELYVDLSGVAEFPLNDMCVDRDGGLYVGNYGWDLPGQKEPRTTRLIYVSPEREARWVGGEIWFPNGTVITPDRRLIVIESYGNLSPAETSRILEYDVADDGGLENEREFHRFEENIVCDGCCLDADGAIWIGTPFEHGFIRVEKGVGVTDRIDLGEVDGIAPGLGGPDGRTLFMLCSEYGDFQEVFERKCDGTIRVQQVDVPVADPPSP